MKNKIKSIVNIIINNFLLFLSYFKIGKYILDQIIIFCFKSNKNIKHNNININLTTVNNIARYRAETFSTKEPETLEWIDKFEKKSIFYDIGANIGLYSCYAAIKKNCEVYSFEPSVFNLELLARNINSNKISKLVTIIPIPLYKVNDKSLLKYSNTNHGGALNTFKEEYSSNGSRLNTFFEHKTISFSLNSLVNMNIISKPDYIKIDVDGIEHLILEGCLETLTNVKSILVEVNEEFEYQKLKVSEILEKNNFILTSYKNHSVVDGNYNQIWIKKN